MEILEKLFGGTGRVKIMRLFLYNPEKACTKEEISMRAKVSPREVAKEMLHLEKVGLVIKKSYIEEIAFVDKRTGKKKVSKQKAVGWVLNKSFEYLIPLQNLLINLNTLRHEDVAKKISSVGKIKLLVLAGIFIQDPSSRLDVLVVGDRLKRNAIEATMRNIEAELGKELRYAVFETEDFKYRMGVYDKLIRDVFDYSHTRVIDKIFS